MQARSFDQLSGFYDACAQLEIDEFRNYERALGALKEAAKYLTKSRTQDKERRVDSLRSRIGLVERFVAARKLVSVVGQHLGNQGLVCM